MGGPQIHSNSKQFQKQSILIRRLPLIKLRKSRGSIKATELKCKNCFVFKITTDRTDITSHLNPIHRLVCIIK